MSDKNITPKHNNVMRRSALLIIRTVILLMCAVALRIVYTTVYANDSTIDWLGIAAFIGALSPIVLAVLGPKAYQKRFENTDTNISTP
jgi:hypothetical protein